MRETLSSYRFAIRRIVCHILFALISAIRITESEKRFTYYSSQSFSEIYLYQFISSEVWKSSRPRFSICGHFRGVRNLTEKGWVAFEQ